jgi:prevent-host-death family protein
MRRLTATEAARRFSHLLDAVESRGESFLVVRRGRAVARIEPAASGSGSAVKNLLRRRTPDRDWLSDLRETRAVTSVEVRHWRD